MSTANRAIHGRSFLSRMASQIGCSARRFLRRVSLLDLIRNVDKLF